MSGLISTDHGVSYSFRRFLALDGSNFNNFEVSTGAKGLAYRDPGI